MLVMVLLTVTLPMAKISVFAVITVLMLFPLFVIVVLEESPFWFWMEVMGPGMAVGF